MTYTITTSKRLLSDISQILQLYKTSGITTNLTLRNLWRHITDTSKYHNIEHGLKYIAFYVQKHIAPEQNGMTTSNHRDAFCIIGPLWMESISRHFSQSKRAVMRNFGVFFVIVLNILLNKHSHCQWFEKHDAHMTVMKNSVNIACCIACIIHIEARTKWPTFCRRYFQINFLER